MEKQNKFLFFGTILGLSLIISAFVVSQSFLSLKKIDDAISVSGSAKQKVSADSARWTGNFSRLVTVDQIKNGYMQMKADEKIVADFFSAQGLAKEAVEISPVFMNEVYNSNNIGPKQYNLIQNIEVKSSEVEKLKEIAKGSDKLAEAGVIFSTNPVEYYYSKLPEIRISLLPEAIKDAKERAGAIATASGKKVEVIKSVSMGVVQVMPVGAVEISDYGSYDTSSIEKEVMVTVKAVFGLE